MGFLLEKTIMVVRTVSDPTLELGHKSVCLVEDWPDTIFLMATRKWEHVLINDIHYELQTSFFSGTMAELDHGLVSWFFTSIANDEFREWASVVGTKFAKNEITKNWLQDQTLNFDLNGRFQVQMIAITTMPSSSPTGIDDKSLHLGFILSKES